MRTKIFLVMFAVLLIAPLVQAAPQPMYGPPGAQYQADSPMAVLKEGVGKLTAFIGRDGGKNPQQLKAFLDQEIAPYFDFGYMTRWAAGKRYRYMNAKQRAQMEEAIRGTFLKAMAQHLSGYRHSRVQFVPSRGNPRTGEVKVSLVAYSYGGRTQRLDFRLYRAPDGWKVFDVSANGQSAVAHYRSVFSRQFSGGGYPGHGGGYPGGRGGYPYPGAYGR